MPLQLNFLLERINKLSKIDDYNLNETGLIDWYSFDNFVVGEGNSLAHAAALKVAETPTMFNNPLYIYSGYGQGKTHLLHAIGNHIIDNSPNQKVLVLSAEEFETMYTESLGSGIYYKFQKDISCVDILLLDDIHHYARESTQDALLQTFHALNSADKQIILTSVYLPSEIEYLKESLQFRFVQGLIADISPPDLDTKVAILKKKASEKGVDIQDDVAFFVAEKTDNNVRALEGALTQIAFIASHGNKPITMELAHNALNPIYHQDIEKEPLKLYPAL